MRCSEMAELGWNTLNFLKVKGGVIWSRISFWRSVRQQKTTTKLVTTAKPNFLLVPKT